MASRTIIELTDDLDGSPGAETVRFGLDGAEHEIDLNKSNAEKLRKVLTPYVSAARTVGRRRGGRRTSSDGRGASRDREQLKAIREWAKENGHKVSQRGRIPAEIEEAYNQAH